MLKRCSVYSICRYVVRGIGFELTQEKSQHSNRHCTKLDRQRGRVVFVFLYETAQSEVDSQHTSQLKDHFELTYKR